MLLVDRADLIDTECVCDGSADTASMLASSCPFSAASCWICPIFHPRSNSMHPAAAVYMKPQYICAWRYISPVFCLNWRAIGSETASC